MTSIIFKAIDANTDAKQGKKTLAHLSHDHFLGEYLSL